MPLRGRPRKPTELRKLGGETRPSRNPSGEPRFNVVCPPAPKELGKIARAKWKEIARILSKVRVLTEADVDVLYGYCVMYERAQIADEEVETEGITITEHRGSGDNSYTIKKENPAVNVSKQARKLALDFGIQLGLTPIARQKVHGEEEEEKHTGELLAFDGGKK